MDYRAQRDTIVAAHDLRTEFPYEEKPKSVAGGKYFLALCPFHPRGPGTPSLGVWADHFFCFSCGVRGDIFSLVMWDRKVNFFEAFKLLGGQTPVRLSGSLIAAPQVSQVPPPPPEPLSDSLMLEYFEALNGENAKYLLQMGFTMDTLEWAGIKVIFPGVYAWPIWEDGKLADVKRYDPLAQHPTKWMTCFPGHSKHLYMVDEIKRRSPDFAVIWESEKDALMAWQHGIPSLASGGATTWPPAFTQRLIDLSIKKIFVHGDNDSAGTSFNTRVAMAWRRAIKVDWSIWKAPLPKGFDFVKFICAGGSRAEYFRILEAAEHHRFVYRTEI
jgi:hypothetical protein